MTRAEKILPYALMFVGVFFVWHDFNGDLWFMLNGGRYVLENGIPHVEPFTIHENLDFVMQQWLTNVLFWEIYKNFGASGLFVLESLLSAAIIALYYRLCKKAAGDCAAAFAAAGVVGVLLAFTAFTVRPQMFSYTVLLLLVTNIITGGRRWVPFVLSAMLINLHAAMWPVMFAFLLPFAVGVLPWRGGEKYFLLPERDMARRAIFAAVTVLAGGFVNPYGTDAMVYGFLSYADPVVHHLVSEMLPWTKDSNCGMIFFLLAAAVFFVLGRKRLPLSYFLFAVGTGYMTLSSERNFPLFLLFGTLPIVYAARNLKIADEKRATKVGAVLFVFFVLLSFFDARRAMDKTGWNGEEAVELLQKTENRENIRMFIGYNGVANYMEFCGIRCYLDTRAEIFLKENNHREDILDEYYDLHTGYTNCRKFFAAHDFTHAYVSETDPIVYREMAEDPAFELLWEKSFKNGKLVIGNRLYKVNLQKVGEERDGGD